MKNNHKLKVLVASISLMLIAKQAYAGGMPVFDALSTVQNTITATATTAMQALEKYYKPRQDAQGSATAQNTAATTEAVNTATQQSVNNVQANAYHMRSALGEAAEAKILEQSLPTYAQCVEASGNTEGAPKTSAQGGASKSTRGGGGSAPKVANNITSSAAAAGSVLKDKASLQTCHEAIVGAAGCTEANSNSAYSKGDSEPRGIKGNIKNLTLANEKSDTAEFNNYTFEEVDDKTTPDGYKVALKYVTATTLYDAPKVVKDKTAMSKNPSYAAMYDSMMAKLNASTDSLIDVLKMRRKGTKDLASAPARKDWDKISNSDFKKVTGLNEKPKGPPSMFDLVNYNVLNDYFGNSDADLSSTEETNKRVALQNYIAWSQYKQQENTNILLSHMLVQLTTPITKAQVDAEYNKTMSYSTPAK